MESPGPVGGHGSSLSNQGQVARMEWRVVTESSGRERLVGEGAGNHTRAGASTRPRANSGVSAGSSRNGHMFHPPSSGHSSDSDHHTNDIGGHLMGGSISPQQSISQSIGQGDDAVLYEEMHRAQQRNEHLESGLSSMSIESGLTSLESQCSDETLQQRLHGISRQREQLQQEEVELRAQYIARAEVMRMQHDLEEKSKQHAEIVANLRGQIQEREQDVRHVEQQLEERERQLHVNQIETNEAVWAKDGLLREQTNELANLRRERDNVITEHKAAVAQHEAERAEHMVQLENLKEKIREKERQMQEIEEQHRSTQDMLLYKDEQLRDAQVWMARAQELDAYHINTNNQLHAELRDRTDQINQLWLGYQRQLADVERYHAQLTQRLQQEINEAREQNRSLKGAVSSDIPDTKGERSSQIGSKDVGKHDSDDSGSKLVKVLATGNSGAKTNMFPNGSLAKIMGNGIGDGVITVMLPRDGLPKVEHAPGLPVVPAPLLGITPVLPAPNAALHQFGMHQQGVTQTLQVAPLPVAQSATPQLQPMATILAPQHHLASNQQAIHHHHHQSQQHQAPEMHGLSQRPQHQQAPSLSPLHSSALPSQMQQARNQDQNQLQQQELVAHEQAVAQSDQQSALLSQPVPQQHAHITSVKGQQQQSSPPLLHPQQQLPLSKPVTAVSEEKDTNPQSQHEEKVLISTDLQHHAEDQKQPDLSAKHRQGRQQAQDQRRRIDSRLQHYSHQQSKQPQPDSHQLLQRNVNLQQQLQHQQGIASSMEHLGGGPQPTSTVPLSQETSASHIQHEAPLQKTSDSQELQTTAAVVPKQNYGEAISKTVEPVLLDERSLLACLVRAVPADPASKIRINSTLPNRLGKMLAPLHWYDYKKQYGRLDEFVGSHPELFIIEGEFIYLREGAHATVSATTAVAKAAAAAAAVTPLGSARSPTVAVTPVAQSQLHRVRSFKVSPSASLKDSKVASPLDTHAAGPPSPQPSTSGTSRHNQIAAMNRSTERNGNINQHPGNPVIASSISINNGSMPDGQHSTVGQGLRSNGVPLNIGTDSTSSFENGGINGYSDSGRGGGHYSRHGRGSNTGSGQNRKPDNQVRPQTQEGRIVGSNSSLAL